MSSYFKNKKILVTGGAGFIGSNLVERIVSDGAIITVFDNLTPDTGANLYNLNNVKDQIETLIGDLRDAQAVENAVKDKDIIFNLAGLLNHHASMTNPLEDLSVNTEGQIVFLESVRKNNPRAKIIYTGSRNEYGLIKHNPVDEEHSLDPSDANSISMTAGGSYHMLYARVYDLPIVYLRLPNVYGPRHQMQHPKQGVLNWFVRQVMDGQEITLYGTGEQIRDCNYVGDVVEALIMSAENPKAMGQVFNLGGTAVSLKDYVEELIRVNGEGSYKLIPFPEDAKKIEIGDYVADTSKIKKALGWEAKTSLNQGLTKTLEFYKKHREHYWN